MNPPLQLPASRCFSHDAMNTTFTFRVTDEPPQYDSILRECCGLLDELEGRLSRFIESSEISRINQLQAGETLYLGEDTHRCLLLAMHARAETGGLFDVTLGRSIARLKDGGTCSPGSEEGRLILHPDSPAITCETPGRELDLGGIGKGYALDRIVELLTDWEVPGALLGAGDSTLLAYGSEAWPVRLAGAEGEPVILHLRNQALSASGTELQGRHVVHPGDDDGTTRYLSDRVWVTAASAVMADVWSTALMLMTREQAELCLADLTPMHAAYAELGGRVVALKEGGRG